MLHSIKVSDEPLELFLTDGAAEALVRYLNSIAGENPDVKVLKVAPIGKAAYNIRETLFAQDFKYQQIEDFNTVLLIMID